MQTGLTHPLQFYFLDRTDEAKAVDTSHRIPPLKRSFWKDTMN